MKACNAHRRHYMCMLLILQGLLDRTQLFAPYIDGKPKNVAAHRYAWILTHGEPEAGQHVLHKCDNPPCCNPAHLRLGTHDQNMAEMAAKGRQNGGSLKTRKPVLWPDRVRPGVRKS